MSISTMEQLEATPMGTSVTLQQGGVNHTWLRAEGGLQRDGVTLPLGNFSHPVGNGMLSVGSPFEVGQWRRFSGYPMFCAGQIDGQFCFVQFAADGSECHGMIQGCGAVEALMIETPEWATPLVASAARHIFQQYRSQAAAQAAQVSQTQTVETLRSQVESVVHEWLDDEGAEHDSDLENRLERVGISPRPAPEEDIWVDVTVRGTTEYDDLDVSTAERFVESNRHFDVDDLPTVTLGWHGTVRLTRTVVSGECGCGSVDSEDVEEWLQDNNVTYEDFDYESDDCENCS